MSQLSFFKETSSLPIQYWPSFLHPLEADQLLHYSQALDWQHSHFPRFGKPIPLPRLKVLFGDSESMIYTYSGSVALQAKPWPPFLTQLRIRVEAATRYRYQMVMGNQYRDGQDSMGYHADDEPTLGPHPAIASISLGASRTFRVRPKTGRKPSYAYSLNHGDLLLMQPGCQAQWVHAIPKSSKSCGVRVNWTFRPYISPKYRTKTLGQT